MISHAADDDRPRVAGAISTAYNRNVATSVHTRSAADVRELFGDLDILDPGVVPLPYWRPDPPGPPEGADQLRLAVGGVARKPGAVRAK